MKNESFADNNRSWTGWIQGPWNQHWKRCLLQIGQNPSVRKHGIIDYLSLGEKTHTFAFGHVATEPFHLGEAEYKSLMRLDHLTEKSMQIEVSRYPCRKRRNRLKGSLD